MLGSTREDCGTRTGSGVVLARVPRLGLVGVGGFGMVPAKINEALVRKISKKSSNAGDRSRREESRVQV